MPSISKTATSLAEAKKMIRKRVWALGNKEAHNLFHQFEKETKYSIDKTDQLRSFLAAMALADIIEDFEKGNKP
jgi:hypothetical protein